MRQVPIISSRSGTKQVRVLFSQLCGQPAMLLRAKATTFLGCFGFQVCCLVQSVKRAGTRMSETMFGTTSQALVAKNTVQQIGHAARLGTVSGEASTKKHKRFCKPLLCSNRDTPLSPCAWHELWTDTLLHMSKTRQSPFFGRAQKGTRRKPAI